MARIVGVDIPRNKKVSYSLCYIHGIGLSTAKIICKKAKIDLEKRTIFGIFSVTLHLHKSQNQTLRKASYTMTHAMVSALSYLDGTHLYTCALDWRSLYSVHDVD